MSMCHCWAQDVDLDARHKTSISLGGWPARFRLSTTGKSVAPRAGVKARHQHPGKPRAGIVKSLLAAGE